MKTIIVGQALGRGVKRTLEATGAVRIVDMHVGPTDAHIIIETAYNTEEIQNKIWAEHRGIYCKVINGRSR